MQAWFPGDAEIKLLLVLRLPGLPDRGMIGAALCERR
jgi:hypothetical protein